MTAPRYYARPWWHLPVTVLVIVAACLAAVWMARAALRAAEQHGRVRAVEEAQSVAEAITRPLAHRLLTLQDSLRRVVAARDTVVVERIRRVRELVADTVRDTVRLPALVDACRALAEDCASYRATAAHALAVADSLHRADSATALALSLRAVAVRDSLAAVTRQRDRRPTWRTTLLTAAAALGVGATAGALLPRTP